ERRTVSLAVVCVFARLQRLPGAPIGTAGLNVSLQFRAAPARRAPDLDPSRNFARSDPAPPGRLAHIVKATRLPRPEQALRRSPPLWTWLLRLARTSLFAWGPCWFQNHLLARGHRKGDDVQRGHRGSSFSTRALAGG